MSEKNLTIAYVTGRVNPMAMWFADSLSLQLGDENIQLIVVDRFAFKGKNPDFLGYSPVWTKPKPTPWQGDHRLTKKEWWAMSNARNTALCLTKNDYLVYVDDVSVLMPGWMDAVRQAAREGYIVCGAYRKVKQLDVSNGTVRSYQPFSEDTRWALAPDEVGPCTGDWLYGCSCGFPVEQLLAVGGWPEFCDGLGSEDYCLGIALQNNGFPLKYDKRMLTLESEEHHHYVRGSDKTWDGGYRENADNLIRRDKGLSPNDKSHAALALARQSKYYPNYYPGGMRELHSFMKFHDTFPLIVEPRHDWFDGQPIAEME